MSWDGPQQLHDSAGRKIGSLSTDDHDVQKIYDEAGRYLGEYRPSSNQTFDEAGRLVGSGNLTGMLLK